MVHPNRSVQKNDETETAETVAALFSGTLLSLTLLDPTK